MHWIYLSPHLDDVVLSVGGLIWEQVQAGDTAEDLVDHRRRPSTAALHAFCRRTARPLGYRRRPGFASAPRRRPAGLPADWAPERATARCQTASTGACRTESRLLANATTFSGRFRREKACAAGKSRDWIAAALPAEARLVSPMTLGGHIDHQLVRSAAESLGRPVWYYADYPYVVDDPLNHSDLRGQIAGIPGRCRAGAVGAGVSRLARGGRGLHIADQHLLGQPGRDAGAHCRLCRGWGRESIMAIVVKKPCFKIVLY